MHLSELVPDTVVEVGAVVNDVFTIISMRMSFIKIQIQPVRAS